MHWSNGKEIKCVQLKSKKLKFLCLDCENGLAELPSLKSLVNLLKDNKHPANKV